MPFENTDSLHDPVFYIDENTRSIMDAVNDGVVIIDTNHKVRFVNTKALRMLGYELDEMVGCTCKDVLQTSMCETSCPLVSGIASGKDSGESSTCYTGKKKTIVRASSTFRLLRNERGEIIGGAEIFTDLTNIDELRADLKNRYTFANIIGKNAEMQEIYRLISEAAGTGVPVLIFGEKGTGKELVARAIHQYSRSRCSPFVAVDCERKSEQVLETELFGTGNQETPAGCLNPSSEGDIWECRIFYLKNIEFLSLRLQEMILRFLHSDAVRGNGRDKNSSGIKIIASTSLSRNALMRRKSFIRALFSSLGEITITVPPLRERKEDIPLLVEHFCRISDSSGEKSVCDISPEALELLLEYDYPGNVKELKSIFEQSCACCAEEMIRAKNLPKDIFLKGDENGTYSIEAEKPLKAVEKEIIRFALRKNDGHLQKTAEQLGISRVTLWRRLRKHNLHGDVTENETTDKRR